MGHIKEPEGIDFIINSGTLSDEDRKEISLYIKEYKLQKSEQRKQTASTPQKPNRLSKAENRSIAF